MRSRADSRDRIERLLRLAAFGAMAWAAWLLIAPPPGAPGVAAERADDLGGPAGALARWTAQPAAETLAVRLARTPAPALRDWLGALRRAGTPVRWTDDGVIAAAVELLAIPDPAGGTRVMVAAPAGATVLFADSLGTLDSVRAEAGGATLAVPGAPPGLHATVGDTRLIARPESLAARGVVVLGSAGWETKFAMAALEERGWQIHARIPLAPGIEQATGRPFPLDTARHAAVVVLDTLGAADAAQVARFVAAGGGLLLSSAASRGALAALAPAREAEEVRATTIAFDATAPRRFLAFTALDPLPGAAVLERQGGRVAVAVRRAGTGRVAMTGFAETWRWRLGGGDDAAEEHAAWWAGLVATVAYRAAAAAAPAPAVDPAPRAALVAAVGESAAAPAATRARRDPQRWLPLAAGLLFAALLLEWGSRRLRGAA